MQMPFSGTAAHSSFKALSVSKALNFRPHRPHAVLDAAYCCRCRDELYKNGRNYHWTVWQADSCGQDRENGVFRVRVDQQGRKMNDCNCKLHR